MSHETAFWVASVVVAGAMVGITLLAVVLWRTKHVAQQAGAAVLLLESVAVSGLAVQLVVRLLIGTGAFSLEAPLRLWVPAAAGVAIAAIAAAVRPSGSSGRQMRAGSKQ